MPSIYPSKHICCHKNFATISSVSAPTSTSLFSLVFFASPLFCFSPFLYNLVWESTKVSNCSSFNIATYVNTSIPFVAYKFEERLLLGPPNIRPAPCPTFSAVATTPPFLPQRSRRRRPFCPLSPFSKESLLLVNSFYLSPCICT